MSPLQLVVPERKQECFRRNEVLKCGAGETSNYILNFNDNRYCMTLFCFP